MSAVALFSTYGQGEEIPAVTASAPAPSRMNLTQAHLSETAYIVKPGKWLVSLRQVSYGLFEKVAVETIPLYSFFGSWSLFGKVKLIDVDPWTWSVRGGIFYITLDSLPEIQHRALHRYVVSSMLSVRLSEIIYTHFSLSNSSLHGNILGKQLGLQVMNELTNLDGDIEYRVSDKRRILGGSGYNFSTKIFSMGGSHYWDWTKVFLKFGLTFKMATAHQRGISFLPFFDVGVHL